MRQEERNSKATEIRERVETKRKNAIGSGPCFVESDLVKASLLDRSLFNSLAHSLRYLLISPVIVLLSPKLMLLFTLLMLML
jgi:hypothetical protein